MDSTANSIYNILKMRAVLAFFWKTALFTELLWCRKSASALTTPEEFLSVPPNVFSTSALSDHFRYRNSVLQLLAERTPQPQARAHIPKAEAMARSSVAAPKDERGPEKKYPQDFALGAETVDYPNLHHRCFCKFLWLLLLLAVVAGIPLLAICCLHPLMKGVCFPERLGRSGGAAGEAEEQLLAGEDSKPVGDASGEDHRESGGAGQDDVDAEIISQQDNDSCCSCSYPPCTCGYITYMVVFAILTVLVTLGLFALLELVYIWRITYAGSEFDWRLIDPDKYANRKNIKVLVLTSAGGSGHLTAASQVGQYCFPGHRCFCPGRHFLSPPDT